MRFSSNLHPQTPVYCPNYCGGPYYPGRRGIGLKKGEICSFTVGANLTILNNFIGLYRRLKSSYFHQKCPAANDWPAPKCLAANVLTTRFLLIYC
jgi:hypothetical protein